MVRGTERKERFLFLHLLAAAAYKCMLVKTARFGMSACEELFALLPLAILDPLVVLSASKCSPVSYAKVLCQSGRAKR